MSTQPILVATNLTAGYRSGANVTEVISEASLQLRSGEVTCLLGANGAGKSTLLRTLCGQQPPLAGRVLINGCEISSLRPKETARLISVVYTERTHAGGLTVEETVGLGRQPYTGFFGRIDDDDRTVIDDSLSAVGISSLRYRYLATLSDGERQKVMIARALAQQTPLMLLDEPTSFLDVASRLEVMDLLARLAAGKGKAILLSTHDVAPAISVASSLWLVMPDKRIVTGPADKLIAEGAMDRLFQGRAIHFDPAARDYRL